MNQKKVAKFLFMINAFGSMFILAILVSGMNKGIIEFNFFNNILILILSFLFAVSVKMFYKLRNEIIKEVN